MDSSSDEENSDIYMGPSSNEENSDICMDSISDEETNLFEQLFVTARKLGSGGQGAVYECTERSPCAYRYRENGGMFAVKIIQTDDLTQEMIASLQTELELLNQINGEAHIIATQIVPVFHAYEVANCTYMLMERMVGGSLTDWQKQRESRRVSESDTRLICRSLFEALDYCHQRRIAHRDIKPCNLLLARPNDLTSLKIADFGMAKIVPPNGLTTVCGTLYFFAPELVLRMRYDTKCDMWSAGVMVYRLLSGRLPFTSANNFEEYLQDIVRHEINYDDFPWQHVSDEAKAFVRRLLTRHPRRRLTAAEALRLPWMMIPV